MSSLLQ